MICLPTKHLGVLSNSFKRVRAFQIELEFGSETGVPRENLMGALERTNNKIRVASTLGFEPWPHWWEADVLTTAPPLLPMRSCFEMVQSHSHWIHHP